MIHRRWLQASIMALIGLPIAALLATVVALSVTGVTIDASRWRETSAEHLSTALGRTVLLEGPIELSLSRAAELRVGGMRILNPSAFTTQEFIAVADARIRIDVLDLLNAMRGEWHLHSVEASDVRLKLERAEDGRNNWTLTQQRDPDATRRAISIGQISLRRLAIDFHDARTAKRHLFDLDELSASVRWREALHLTMRGHLDKQFPFTLTAEGGPLRLIQEASGAWPFALDFESPGARLQASGTIDTDKGEAHVHFGPNAKAPAPVAQIRDSGRPHLADDALSGRLATPADAIAEPPENTTTNTLAGQLTLALGSARPRLSGTLSIATLDLRPFLALGVSAPEKVPDSAALQRQMLPLRDLLPLDVDVDLSIARWIGLPVDIRDTKFDLHADTNGLRVPISATMASVPFSGRLDLDTAAPKPALAFRFAAQDIALGGLVPQQEGGPGIEGGIGHIELRLGGRGETLGSLINDLELSLKAANADLRYGRPADGNTDTITIDTLDLALRRGQKLRGSARGTLLGEPARLSMRGGTLHEMLRESALPIELEIAATPAKLNIDGTLAPPDAMRETRLNFAFEARRMGSLARWMDVAPASNLPLVLRGRTRITTDTWHLEQTRLKLGRSELTINAQRSRTDERPITAVSVRSPLIDVRELATLRAGTGRSGDMPVFPDAADLADTDLNLTLQRVDLGYTELEDVGFAARVREGRLTPSALTGKVASAPFSGLVALDLRDRIPEARLDLSAREIDVGALLRDLGAAEDIDGRAEKLQLSLRARGNNLRELANLSSFEARVVGGNIRVLGALDRPVADIRITEAKFWAPPAEPIRLQLDGMLDETVLDLRFSSGTLADLLREETILPFSLAAKAAGTRLTLEGEVALPLGQSGRLTIEMSGERLDSLSGLARVELPAWGPWSLRAPLRMTRTGYELPGLLIRVGDNQLKGTASLDVSGPRPRFDMQLRAPSIQLDDFPLPERLADAPPAASIAETLRQSASKVAVRSERLLGAGFLRRFDAYLGVEIEEVLSGVDRLADGSLYIQVVDGLAFLGPAVVNIPGGTLRLSAAYDPGQSGIELAAGAYVERFDYGIIARRLRRGENIRGLVSMDMALAGKAPSLDTIMHHADGKIDIAVWPTELRSGVFNLWSVNLVLRLVPLIDPGSNVRVNCIVGRFDLEDGKLDIEKFIIDTSRVRVRGEGGANLASEQVAFVFRPRGKGAALFRLQTPLRVGGTLTDFQFGVKPHELIGSVLRLIASPILLPIEWLTLGPLPRDGADVCTNPLREHDPGP